MAGPSTAVALLVVVLVGVVVLVIACIVRAQKAQAAADRRDEGGPPLAPWRSHSRIPRYCYSLLPPLLPLPFIRLLPTCQQPW